MASPTSSLAPGKRLSNSRIELVEIVGQGGMSTVWRGWLHGSRSFRRPVAIKHMSPQLAKQTMYREMFFEEARVGALLQDPNIPQVYEYLVAGNDHHIIMELVDGINLATLVRHAADRKTTLPWELVAAIGVGVLRGLAAAHERVGDDGEPSPVIHRDVSPHNVLISTKGPAKLIDFGLAFARDRRCGDTGRGVVKGKLPYISPEIARGERPSPASDQFAAGSVLWEGLVGRRLFDDFDRKEAFRKLSAADAPLLRSVRADVPEAFERVVARALSLAVEDRFPSTREMAKQLGDVLKGSLGKEDLYATIAQTVARARRDLAMGNRTEMPPDLDAPQEAESGLVELIGGGRPAGTPAPAAKKPPRPPTRQA